MLLVDYIYCWHFTTVIGCNNSTLTFSKYYCEELNSFCEKGVTPVVIISNQNSIVSLSYILCNYKKLPNYRINQSRCDLQMKYSWDIFALVLFLARLSGNWLGTLFYVWTSLFMVGSWLACKNLCELKYFTKSCNERYVTMWCIF